MKTHKLNPKNIHIKSDMNLSLDFDIPQFQFIVPKTEQITVYTGNKKDKSKSLW